MESDQNRAHQHGFTLLEMSVVLIIIAVIFGSAIAIFSASIKKHQMQETYTKMQTLQKALLDYRIAFNRLPCPADARTDNNDANFGAEVASPGACEGANYSAWGNGVSHPCTVNTDGSDTLNITFADYLGPPIIGSVLSGDIVTNGYVAPGQTVTGVVYGNGPLTWAVFMTGFIDTAAGTTNCIFGPGQNAGAAGMIPTQALRLPDDYAFDGWGRRFNYSVNVDLTQANAFGVIGTTRNFYTVINWTSTYMSNLPGYSLMSSGPNGHGAYPRNGGNIRINSNSINGMELANCHCSVSSGNIVDIPSGAYANLFAQFSGTYQYTPKTPSINPSNRFDTYDDIVVQVSRSALVYPATYSPSAHSGSALTSGGGCGFSSYAFGNTTVYTDGCDVTH
jgi:prepilin-type N-terminal cleavage/methylation domain-containing protein